MASSVTMASAVKECLIDYEPDISGIGIRASLYLQTTITPLLVKLTRSAELESSLYSSLGLSALALLLTLVIHTFTSAITLYDGILAFHLISLVGITIQSKYQSAKGLNPITYYAFTGLYYIATSVFLIWSIYLFANAPSFGQQPDCNYRTIYVIFFVNIKVAGSVFRWIVVAGLVLVVLGVLFQSILLIAFAFIVQKITGKRPRFQERGHPISTREESKSTTTAHVAFTPKPSSPESESGVQADPETGVKRKVTIKLNKEEQSKILVHFVGCAYLITMLELMIYKNPKTTDQRTWSFGQVLALFLLLGPILELIAFGCDRWKSDWFEKLKKEQEKKDGPREGEKVGGSDERQRGGYI